MKPESEAAFPILVTLTFIVTGSPSTGESFEIPITVTSKSGIASVTCSDMYVLWVNAPLVPVTVRVDVPGVAVVPTETVRVEVAVPPAGGVTCEGLSVAVTPKGAPETLS